MLIFWIYKKEKTIIKFVKNVGNPNVSLSPTYRNNKVEYYIKVKDTKPLFLIFYMIVFKSYWTYCFKVISIFYISWTHVSLIKNMHEGWSLVSS